MFTLSPTHSNDAVKCLSLFLVHLFWYYLVFWHLCCSYKFKISLFLQLTSHKHRLSSLLCVFLASVELTRDFCEQLDCLVGPQLTLLASDICEQFTINRRISGSVENPMLCWLTICPVDADGQIMAATKVKFSIKYFLPSSILITKVSKIVLQILKTEITDFSEFQSSYPGKNYFQIIR